MWKSSYSYALVFIFLFFFANYTFFCLAFTCVWTLLDIIDQGWTLTLRRSSAEGRPPTGSESADRCPICLSGLDNKREQTEGMNSGVLLGATLTFELHSRPFGIYVLEAVTVKCWVSSYSYFTVLIISFYMVYMQIYLMHILVVL